MNAAARLTRLAPPTVCAMALLAPAAASAETLHAHPTGSGTACTLASPCSLETAVEAEAGNGDEVAVAPGNYGLDSSLNVDDAITLRGALPPNRPRVTIDATDGLVVSGSAIGAQLRDLEIAALGSGTALRMAPGAGVTAERLIVVGEGSTACQAPAGGVLRDSLCFNAGSAGDAVALVIGGPLTLSGRLVNVTAVASGGPFADGIVVSAGSGADLTLELTNVIAAGGGGADVVADAAAGTAVAIVADHSNYAIESETGPGTRSVTDPGSGTNQTAAPALVAGVAEFHQLSGSPTVDKGASAPAQGGTLDLDGEPRTQGVSQDIGADELTVSTQPPLGPPGPGPTVADLTASLLGRKAAVKKAGVVLSFACADGACDANTVLLRVAAPGKQGKAKRRRKFAAAGKATFSVPRLETRKVRVKLSKRGRKLLRGRRSAHARVEVSGGGGAYTANLKLRIPRSKRR